MRQISSGNGQSATDRGGEPLGHDAFEAVLGGRFEEPDGIVKAVDCVQAG